MVFNINGKSAWALVGSMAISYFSIAHAFYVSVYSVRFDSQYQEMKMVCKVFTNDLEDAVKKDNNTGDLSINPQSDDETKKQVVNYLLKKTRIAVNGKPAPLIFDHLSWEGTGITQTTLCHFKIKNISYVKTIKINTSLLTELYDDQVNIINIQIGDKRKALNLDKRVKQGELDF